MKRISEFLLVVAILSLPINVFAVEQLPTRLSVEQSSSYFYNADEESYVYGRFRLSSGFKGEGWKLSGRLSLQGDSVGNYQLSSWNEPSQDSSTRSVFGFDKLELTLGFQELGFDLPGETTIMLGKQIVTWGATDTIRPTNLLVAPYDYTRLTDEERVGQWAVSIEHRFGWWSGELLWSPFFSPHLFANDGPWQIVPDGLRVDERRYANSDVGANQMFAGQLCYEGRRHNPNAPEICGFGFHGRDRYPVLNGFDGQTFQVSYPEVSAVGLNGSVAVLGFSVRGEALQRFYESGAGVKDYAEVVLGLERIVEIPSLEQLGFFLLQYSRQIPKQDDPLLARSVFADALSGRVRVGNLFGAYFEIEGAVSLDKRGHSLEARFSIPVRNLPGLRAEVVYGNVSGSDEHLFGQLEEADRVGVEFVYRTMFR